MSERQHGDREGVGEENVALARHKGAKLAAMLEEGRGVSCR